MLLADDILTSRARPWMALPDREAIVADLQRAEKFVLEESVSRAADAMSRDEVQRILPFCRTPFPLVWVETAHSFRPSFVAAPLDKNSSLPHRVGLLIKSIRHDGSSFHATLFWNFDEPGQKNTGPLYSVLSADFDAKDPGVANRSHLPSEYAVNLIRRLSGLPRSDLVAKEFLTRAQSDWAGEMIYWMGILGLMNCQNAVNVTHIDNSEWNKRRKRLGQKPRVDHHVCSIRLGRAERVEGLPAGEMTATRAHFVRGHFKVRRSGIFWWSPYVRGDLALGFAHKTYSVSSHAPH